MVVTVELFSESNRLSVYLTPEMEQFIATLNDKFSRHDFKVKVTLIPVHIVYARENPNTPQTGCLGWSGPMRPDEDVSPANPDYMMLEVTLPKGLYIVNRDFGSLHVSKIGSYRSWLMCQYLTSDGTENVVPLAHFKDEKAKIQSIHRANELEYIHSIKFTMYNYDLAEQAPLVLNHIKELLYLNDGNEELLPEGYR